MQYWFIYTYFIIQLLYIMYIIISRLFFISLIAYKNREHKTENISYKYNILYLRKYFQRKIIKTKTIFINNYNFYKSFYYRNIYNI